jgi:IPT/TIG domain
MSRNHDLCHRGVSQPAFAPRIEAVRRTFILSSALVAALTVAWSATPVSATASARAGHLTATSQHLGGDSHASDAHTLSAAAVVAGSSPSLLQNQPGLSDLVAIAHAGTGNPNVTSPADPSIAIGPSNIVEAVNSALEVSTRSGASPVVMNISAMVGNTSGFSLRYPHVVYDPVSGRFILMVLEYNPVLSGCASLVELMLSQANPALPWITRGSINIDPEIGGGVEFSTLSLAITGSLLVETSDYESCTTGLPVASQMEVIRRADFISGAFNANSDAFVEPGPVGLQPAQAWTAQSVGYAVANDANCTTVGKVPGSIAVFAINGLPSGGAVSVTCTAGSETTATSTPPVAAQGGTAATLTTGTDRFLSAVWQGNVLWVAGNTGCTPSGDSQARSCVNVVSIPATGTSVGTPTQLPVESVSGAYLYDPALAVDSADDAILTFDKSSSSALEAMMVAAITGGVWSTLTTLHPSTNFYQPAACSTCIWGDYSAAVQDPSRPTDVWVVSEENDGNTGTGCLTANTCWNTYIGRYTFAGPVIASLSPAAGPASGGELVTVAGYDFGTDSTFTFNGAPVLPTTGSLTPDAFTFTTPPGASGLVEGQVQDSLGTSPITVGSGYIYVGLANYHPILPYRILDTRPTSCVQCVQDPTFGAGTIRKVQLIGLSFGVAIPSDSTAVVLNVTEVAGNANSLLTVYPFGTGLPRASNLNFAAGKVIANLVTVTLGQGGAIDIYNAAGTVNVLADVEGYFEPAPPSTVTGEFHPIAPVRVCDTRSTSPTPACKAHGILGPGAAMLVNVTGIGIGSDSVPADGSAAGVVVNLTGVAGSALTFLSLSATTSTGQCPYSGTHGSPFSNVSLSAGLVAANRVMVQLGPSTTGGHTTSLCVFNAAGSINVVVDVNGWFGSSTAAAGAQYQAIQPTRICDTRTLGGGPGCAGHAIAPPTPSLITVAGQGGIPGITSGTTVVAVIANLTAIAPTAPTYLVIYPATPNKAPNSSDINLSPGEVLPNLVVVQLDPLAGAGQGDADLYNAAGSVNAVVDIEGWFQ